MERKAQIIDLLNKENKKLNSILTGQSTVYNCVKTKNWIDLSFALENLNKLSDEFYKLDCKREEFFSRQSEDFKDKEISNLIFELKNKLIKSKIENDALNSYVNTCSKFINGILDECIPQQKNTLYTKSGSIKKPAMHSVLIDKTL